MPYGTLVMENGEEVYFEFDGPYAGPVSDEGVVHGLRKRFEQIVDLIQETAHDASVALSKMEGPSKPSEYEITFGIKLTADAGVVFAKAGTEGTFTIKLKWASN